MIKAYTCPTCGYDKAIWHINLNSLPQNLCENCLPKFITPKTHITSHALNRVYTKYYDMPRFVKPNIAKLHSLRVGLGFSQVVLAELTGLTSTSISGYERGISIPYRKQYNKLAEFFEWEIWQ